MKKKIITVDISAEELRKKLNIKDGRNGIDGKNGITPSTTEVALEASKLSVEQLKQFIPTQDTIQSEIEQNGERVRNSLELLEGNERLDKSAIRGIDDYDEVARLAREPKIEKIYQGGGGAKMFTQLIDVPNSYSGQSGKVTTVKTDESGLEFTTIQSGDKYRTTSTTPQTIVSTGTLTFTVDSGLSYTALQDVIILYDTSNHMHGQVTSYSGTTLVVDIQHKTGSGTYSSWTINLDGVPVDAVTGSGTTDEIAYFTGASVIGSLSTATYPSKTELSYVKGVTSSIQTQLNGKQASGTYVTGATNSTLTLSGTTLGINLATANTWTGKLTTRLTTTQMSWEYDANNKTDITVDSIGSATFSAQNNTSTNNYIKWRVQTMIAGTYLQLGIGLNGGYARLKHSTGNSTSYIDFISNNNRINIVECNITSPFFVGSQYLPDPWLGGASPSSNTNSIRTSVSGTGANQTIIFYTQTYASNVVGPKLQISGQGLDLCVKDQSGSWSTVISKIIFSAGYSTGKISIGDFGTSTPAGATARLEITDTSEQLRVRYDSSNYYKTTVSSTGGVTFDAVGTGASFTFSDKIIVSNPVNLKNYTVATLPTGVRGDIAYVTDALAPTFLTAVTGGGAIVCPVFYDGTNWVAY